MASSNDALFAALHLVRNWHEKDVPGVPTNVCSWWKSGHAADITPMAEVDPSIRSTGGSETTLAIMHPETRASGHPADSVMIAVVLKLKVLST